MEHVVFFSASDGSPAYRRTANLDDAVRVVEHLRNVEGVEDVHVYSLESVALSFRPYYRVEVSAGAPQGHHAQHSAPVSPALVEAAAAVESLAVESLAVDVLPSFEPVVEALPTVEPVFIPAAPLPPVALEPEPLPALAIVAEPAADHAQDDTSTNGRGGRGLGFFTR